MKKFLLSLCMIAVASICVLSITSCKDDDEMQSTTTVSGNFDSIIKGQIDKGVSYSFVIDGQNYSSWDAAKNALAGLPAGSHTFQTVMNKDGQTYKGTPTTFTVPTSGSVTFNVDVPTADAEHSTGAKITLTVAGHGGGAGTVA